ncbi:MAG: ketoacyl-ACP synthase III [Lewinellaceae bacterium]|nr:ketoacyl-ACP synthase III [Saprospiraceae bacterium]MCB9314115.1 ketoacyl-ACP synthase III [Lewinellaceae bacterium]HRW76478.1 beta-ketoacyl-ACP synthase III [Saprospiraceae bacterium]
MKLRAAITGVGGYVPDYILTNAELESMVDTSDEWIFTRTGIRERRILKEPGKGSSDMVVKAMDELFAQTGLKPEEIDLLICATVTADMIFPDTANTICDKIGAVNAFGYDINAACSGFLYALHTGSKFIESGTYKKVVVAGVDKMSSILDYTDRATCVIFGDGAGVVLLEPDTQGFGIVDAVLRADGSGRQYLHMKAGGSIKPPTLETVLAREHYVYQEGKTVFKYAVKGMVDTVQQVLERNGLTTEDIRWLVPHQANKRIISSVGDSLGIPEDRVMVNIEKYGNTTAGTLPLCLWDYRDQLQPGDWVVLTAFGGGFTWGAILIKWKG